jgi:hypothetical protein
MGFSTLNIATGGGTPRQELTDSNEVDDPASKYKKYQELSQKNIHYITFPISCKVIKQKQTIVCPAMT